MTTSTGTCPTCGQTGLATRFSKKTNRPYLAHVETYPNGASYFRAVHDAARCEAHIKRIAEMIQQEVDLAEKQAWNDYRCEMANKWAAAARAEMDALKAAGHDADYLVKASQAIEATRPTAESLRPLYDAQPVPFSVVGAS